MSGLALPVVVALAVLGLFAGIGITAIGPGGVLATIALFALTPLSPAQVAGTAITTHVATGALATAAYTRSGQLREPRTRRTALLLAGAAVAGTPLGVLVNSLVSKRVFGILLGIFIVGIAALVWYRDRRTPAGPHRPPATGQILVVGFGVAVLSGLVGVGGPLLTVPLLVFLGMPVLSALGAAQAQSVVIAGAGTVSYLAAGTIVWPLAALVGIPELVGVLLGWMIAQRLPTRTLKYALVISLVCLAPYLALHA